MAQAREGSSSAQPEFIIPRGQGGQIRVFLRTREKCVHSYPNFCPISWNMRELTILRCNSGGVGERTPGAFLPGIVGLSWAKIVRDHSLSPCPRPAFLIL